MSDDEDLVKLVWVASQSEALIVVDLLAANGIPALGPGGETHALEGIGSDLTGSGVEIWVRAADLEDAKSLLPG